MRRNTLIALILAGCMGLAACGGDPGPTTSTTAIPTLVKVSQPNVTRPPLIVQFCNDDTGSFPRDDFHGASTLMGDSLVAATTANQGGVMLYATAITHNTFDPANTLSPVFTVPMIPAFPIAPTPIPTYEPENPISDPQTAEAVRNGTTQGVIAYNQSVADIIQQIKAAKATVTQDVTRLTSWDPKVDTSATSVQGCFALAASHFKGQSGTKIMYVASDLENNTNVDASSDFVTSHALADVIVHVIFLVSPSASRDQQKRDFWCPFLKSAGARAVLFTAPDQSKTLQDAFSQDAALPATPC